MSAWTEVASRPRRGAWRMADEAAIQAARRRYDAGESELALRHTQFVVTLVELRRKRPRPAKPVFEGMRVEGYE